MTKEQIFLGVITIVLVPLCISAFARLRKLEQGQAKTDEFNTFLKTYLLREAVLTFHSNPNKETDAIIEKISAGETVTQEEYEKLEKKIKDVAENAEEQKKRLRAQSALELLRWAHEGEFQQLATRRAHARNVLFNE